jgi:predicted  nucleic acid-binding Zn-ribbon protein
MIDEKVKIKCTKCSQVFRERATRVRDGLQTNCMHCNRLITFDSNSDDRNIRKALMSAKEVRLAVEAERKAASLAQAAQALVVGRSQY